MSTIPSPINDPLYREPAKEQYEAIVADCAVSVAEKIEDHERIQRLVVLLSGKAVYLAHNLKEIAGFPDDEAETTAWKDTWNQLGRIMLDIADDPTYEVATVIDRASSRVFPSDYDNEGKPSNIALAEFYRRFANNIDTPSIKLTSAWLED